MAQSSRRRPVKLTLKLKRRAFANWQDVCLRKKRDKDGSIDASLIFLGISLSSLMLKKDGDTIADAWAQPVIDAIALLDKALLTAEIYPRVKEAISDKEKVQLADLCDRLDWALTKISRELSLVVYRRAFQTKNTDLLLDVLHHSIGDGGEAVELIHHIQKFFPHIDGSPLPDGENTIASFAWDTYNRVAFLDTLADTYPEHLKSVARQMHAWPVLRHRHTASDARFHALAEQLGLGEDYPLDTTKGARFRPDSPMVVYLDNLIPRLNVLRNCCRRHNTINDRDITHWWHMDRTRENRKDVPSDAVLTVLRRVRDLPELTKLTAAKWTTAVVVPLALVTDAAGPGPFKERALEQVRQQRDIKSRAILRSRLESKISKTLKSLARSA